MTSRQLVILVVAVALIAGLFWVFSQPGTTRPEQHSWKQTLRLDEKEPYDLWLFFEGLKKSAGDKFYTIPEKSSLQLSAEKLRIRPMATYFYAGKRFLLTADEMDILDRHIRGGGSAFISTNGFSSEFLDRFIPSAKYAQNFFTSAGIQVAFDNPKLKEREFKFTYLERGKTESNTWLCFAESKSEEKDQNEEEPLPDALFTVSKINGEFPNCIGIRRGEGVLYLHTNPLLFSNLYLKTDTGRKYLAQVLKHVPNKEVLFDLSAGNYKDGARTENNARPIMDFIREEPSLYYAWWILLCGLIAFLVLGGKRRQRPVPVLSKPTNNTLSFVDTIGHFYLNEKGNINVFKREWNQFLSYIRYNIRFQLTDYSLPSAGLLAERSGVSVETVEKVFSTYEKYRVFSEMTNQELSTMNKLINQFYQEHRNKYGKQSR